MSNKRLKKEYDFETHLEAVKAARNALTSEISNFEIEDGEILVDDKDYFSMTFEVTPKKDVVVEDGYIDGKTAIIQIDIDLDIEPYEPVMIWGEDIEVAVSKENIFEYLYWNEAIKSSGE